MGGCASVGLAATSGSGSNTIHSANDAQTAQTASAVPGCAVQVSRSLVSENSSSPSSCFVFNVSCDSSLFSFITFVLIIV